MIRGNNQITTARIAICAALLCGSSAGFAQEAAVAPAVQPAPTPVSAVPTVTPPAPVVESTTVVAPPPAVATIPQEQLAKPAATSSRSTARAAVVRPATVRSEAAQPQRAAEQPTATPIDPTARMAAPIDDSLPATSTVEDTAPIAPVAASEAATTVDANDDNMIVVGGIAAALGLAGLGAVLARRRRRPVEQREIAERTETIVPVRSETPTFAKPIATAAPVFAAPVIAAEAEPIRPAVLERAAPQFRPSTTDGDLPPVTDPLFSHQVELGPITDPLFSHKAELAPMTDPMFADRDDFMDSGSPSSAFDKRRSWPSASDGTSIPARELEPAE